MILFLDGHDLRLLTIGLLEKGVFSILETVEAAPEEYLARLDHFLASYQIRLQTLEGISIVTGPGSFTSSRISLTIANTLHFVHKLPIFALENPSQLPSRELVERFGIGSALSEGAYARPFYERPPHITSPTGGDKSLED